MHHQYDVFGLGATTRQYPLVWSQSHYTNVIREDSYVLRLVLLLGPELLLESVNLVYMVIHIFSYGYIMY